MDEQTMELFAQLGETMQLLMELQLLEMLASDKYTSSMKIALVQILMELNHGQLPMNLSEVTGKDETALLEMINNNGGNGGTYDYGSEGDIPTT